LVGVSCWFHVVLAIAEAGRVANTGRICAEKDKGWEQWRRRSLAEEQKYLNIMPTHVKDIPVATGKRTEVDVAANDESDPPKKRKRYGSNGWEDLPLKTKIVVYDRLVSAVAVAKKTKGQKIEDIISSSVMPGSTYYRWKRGMAEAIRATIADVPLLGYLHQANFDLKKKCIQGGDNGDVNSEEGKHSHVVPEEITTTANDIEKENELMRLKEQLKGASEELEAFKSQSKYEYDQLQSRLNHSEAQIEKNLEMVAKLEEELLVNRAEKADLESQLMNAATSRLKEKEAKDAANRKWGETAKKFEAANSRWEDQKKKFTDKLRCAEAQLESKSDTVAKLNAKVDEMQDRLQLATSELKAKSNAEAEMKIKIDELMEQNESLWNQLEKQSEGCSAVKEEELTDDEDIVKWWKERGTGMVPVKELRPGMKSFSADSIQNQKKTQHGVGGK